MVLLQHSVMQHWGFSAPKLHTRAFLSEQKCLFKIVLMVRFMSYLDWSQQVTNWLCPTCIKTCKPDTLTLCQRSISRLSCAADFWTFIKCLCLSSSMVGTHSGRAGSKLCPGFGPLHSCPVCASSAHNSHLPEKRDPSPCAHTTALALALPSSPSSTS